MRRQPETYAVTVEVNGTTFDGLYSIQSKVITVHSSYGSTSTQLGGSPAPVLARMLLSEIVAGAKARGEL